MSRPVSNLRLFVAAYPPIDIARELIQRLSTVAMPPHARIASPEHVHLTLQFVGDTPSRDLESVSESVERSAAGLPSFDLKLTRLITLPERGSKRLIAAELDAPAILLELRDRLVRRLARQSRVKSSDRFRPHMTLCRFASPTTGFEVAEPELHGEFSIDRIHLMRSTLWHDGATHHVMASFTLRSP